MTRAECIWCGYPEGTTKSGLLWIHRKCFEEITDCCGDIKVAIEFAKGERPRIKANGDREGYEALEKYLIEMQAFRQKFTRTVALIQKLSQCNDNNNINEVKKNE